MLLFLVIDISKDNKEANIMQLGLPEVAMNYYVATFWQKLKEGKNIKTFFLFLIE